MKTRVENNATHGNYFCDNDNISSLKNGFQYLCVGQNPDFQKNNKILV